MPIETRFVAPAAALPALGDAVRSLQAGDPLAPVSVVVATNAVGVTARRWLGEHGGIAAVDMVTPGRLAERLAGPDLAASGRRPVSAPVIDLAVRAALHDDAGPFGAVAEHPSTVTALRDAIAELRLAGPEAVDALATASWRGRDVARVATAVRDRLVGGWYDEADLLAAATERLTAADVDGDRDDGAIADRVVVFLPALRHRSEIRLLAALGNVAHVHLLVPFVGVPALDDDLVARIVAAGIAPPATPTPDGKAQPHRPGVSRLVSTTDADDEVRHAVRAIVDAARAGTPLARMCILWPTDVPYARLVEHHLDVAGVRWNGRPGSQVAERLVPRFLLDLLQLDRRGLRRTDVFDLLADVPQRARSAADDVPDDSPDDASDDASDDAQAHDDVPVPVARWERVAIGAGVVGDDDWGPRLGRHAHRLRRRAADDDRPALAAEADACDDLAGFVRGLRADLGHPRQRRRWDEWVAWCLEQIETRLGSSLLDHLDAAERLAADHAGRVLDRLKRLDQLSGPVTRGEFRAVFAAEFEQAPGRLGRIGDGVTIGSLSADLGHDAEMVVVLGASDGLMPAPPPVDPLLSERDRVAAGLAPARDRAARAERRFASLAQQTSTLVVTRPRGDLRTAAERPASRWIDRHLGEKIAVEVASSQHGALAVAEFPAHEREHRLRHLLAELTGGHDRISPACATDRVASAGLALRAGRRADIVTEFDGDLSTVSRHRLDAPVSPTQLEAWESCPHGYFARYLLGVRPADDAVDEMGLSPLERGNVVHHTLDRFHREVIDGLLPQPNPGWSDHHVERLLELFEEVADEFERAGRVGRPAPWALSRRRMRAELRGWIAADSELVAARRAQVVRSEVRFGDEGPAVAVALDDGRLLAVRGAADRIDRGDDGTWYVTDHKTGRSTNYSADADDPTVGRTRYQLPVYGAAALALGEVDPDDDVTVRAEYSFLNQAGFDRVGLGLTRDLRQRVAADLTVTVAGIESGLFPAVTEPPKYRHVIACPYCDPDGLGVDERYGEWHRKQHDGRLRRWFPTDDQNSAENSAASSDTNAGAITEALITDPDAGSSGAASSDTSGSDTSGSDTSASDTAPDHSTGDQSPGRPQDQPDMFTIPTAPATEAGS